MSDPTRISQKLVEELATKGGRELFQSAPFRERACRFFRDYGCPPLVDQAVVWVIGGLMQYGIGLSGGKLEQWLQRLIERTPLLRGAFEKLLTIAQSCHEEAELKRRLIDAIASAQPVDMEPSMQSSLEVAEALFSAAQFARLSDTLKQELGDLRSAIHDRFDRYDDVELHDPAFPVTIGSSAARLDFRSETESFRARVDELDALATFLGDKSRHGDQNRVKWWAISGEAGIGKSRLALQFMRTAQHSGWRAGFVTLGELARLRDRSWRPRWDTLVVVDSAGGDASLVSDFLYHCITRAADFEFAVRVLLIERDERTSLERLAPQSSVGRMVRSARYRESLELEAMPADVAIELMEERGRHLALPSLPHETLMRMAQGRGNAGDSVNPLYALAAMERLAIAHADDPSLDIEAMSWGAETIFSDILEEEIETRWRDPGARTGHHDNLVELHGNLLWLATFTRDLNPADLAGLQPPAAELLPGLGLRDPLPFERARYVRMVGGEPKTRLERLRPDLLGEYFLLARLAELSEADATALLQAAYRLGRRSSETFHDCAVDFPELWRKVARLRIDPSEDGATQGYLAAVARGLDALRGSDREDDVEALWEDVKPHLAAPLGDERPGAATQTIIVAIDPGKTAQSEDGFVELSGHVESLHHDADGGDAMPSSEDREKVGAFHAALHVLMNFASAGNEKVSFEALVRASQLMGPLTPGESAVHLIRLAANYFGKAPVDMSLAIFPRLMRYFDPAEPRLAEALAAAGRNIAIAGTPDSAHEVLLQLRPVIEQVDSPGLHARMADIILLAARGQERSASVLEWLAPLAAQRESQTLFATAAKLAFNLSDQDKHPEDDPRWEFVREVVRVRGGDEDEMLARAWAHGELIRSFHVMSRPGAKRTADIMALIDALGQLAIEYAHSGDIESAKHFRNQRRDLLRQMQADPRLRELADVLESGLEQVLADLGITD